MLAYVIYSLTFFMGLLFNPKDKIEKMLLKGHIESSKKIEPTKF